MEHLFSVLIMFGHFKKHRGVVPLIVYIFILPIVYGRAFKIGMPRLHLKYHYFRLKINKILLQRSIRMWFRFNCAILVHLKWHKGQINTLDEKWWLNRDFTVFWQSTFWSRLVPTSSQMISMSHRGGFKFMFYHYETVWKVKKTSWESPFIVTS